MQAVRWSCQALHVFRCSAHILEEVVQFRWGALPDEQREGIWSYLILLPGADPGGGDKVPLGRTAGRAARGHPELLIFTAWRRSWRR